MASQDQLFGRTLLCLQVAKYSYSTLPRSANAIDWSHIQAPDLFFVVEQLDNHAGIQLRVIQGTNDLEILPLTDIIQETKELHKQHPNQPPDNLPIFGLTRGTAFAIRYFCQNNQVRRIQLRFDNDASCNEAVQLLSLHGLMFSVPSKKQDTQSHSRPATSNSFADQQTSVQAARFDRATSSIVVPSVQDTFPSTPADLHQQSKQQPINQVNVSGLNMSSSPSYRNSGQAGSMQRQPTFAPIRIHEDRLYERPSTAPLQWPSDMSRDIWPPRRELPFPKPSSSPTKSRVLPPLPKPSYASEAVKQATSAQVKEDRILAASKPQHSAHERLMRLATPRGPTRFEPPSSSTLHGSGDIDMTTEDHLSISRGANSNATRSNTETAPLTREHPFSDPYFSANSDRVMTSSSLPHLSNVYASSPGRQDVEMTAPLIQSDEEQLRRYAEQNEQTRMDVLNQFVLDNIENDDFMKLCVDVEACWRRKVLDRRE